MKLKPEEKYEVVNGDLAEKYEVVNGDLAAN